MLLSKGRDMLNQKLFTDYFRELFRVSVTFETMSKLKDVPVIINSVYNFYNIDFQTHSFILAEPKNGIITPAEFNKHAGIIKKAEGKNVVLAMNNCTAVMRKQLINYKLSFIVPKKQMYLPELMIDLREHFNGLKVKKKHLTPAAQTVLLYHFYNKLTQPFTPADISEKLNYNKMTATRIINEFELHGLCICEKQGRKRLSRFQAERVEFWEKAFTLLRTPVLNTMYVKEFPVKIEKLLFKAGTTALSELSLIYADKLPVFAIGKGSYYANKDMFVPADFKEDAEIQLEIWSYDPGILSDKKDVDVLSLYLSMINEDDDRIQIVLDEIITGFAWK